METSKMSSNSTFFNTKNMEVACVEVTAGGDSAQPLRKQERALTCTGFEVADWQKALKQRINQSNLYYKGERISPFVNLQYLKMYGSGIYLFFSFLWQVSILFLFLSIVSMVPIVINYLKGNAFQGTQSSLQFYVTRASIGNFLYQSSSLSEQQSIKYKIINVSIDIFACTAFLIFYFYWQKKSEKLVHEINNSVKLLSANTIQLVKFPQSARETDVTKFMSKFGEVVEVAAVKNYADEIEVSKDIYNIRLEIKQLEIENSLQNNACLEEKIAKLGKKAEQLQASSQSKISKQEIIKFYIQFEKSEERDQVLSKFLPYKKSLCCSENPPEEMLLNNERVEMVACQTQPMGIIWQNVHVTWGTRWLRAICQFLIILLVIFVGFILISFLNILQPPTSLNVDTSSYTWQRIKVEADTKIVRSWCINNLDFSSTYQPVCYQYWKSYIFGVLITIGIAIVVVVLKAIIKIIMIFIAKFQRYTSHTQQSVAIMTNLMITYISTTVLITFLIQANVFQISFKSLIKSFIHDADMLRNLSMTAEYYDLTSNWYKDIGYKIWFNVFTLSFIPHVYMPLVLLITECIGQSSASGQKLHKKMYDKIRPSQFQIEDNYANILMIILIGFMFGGGSPFMIIVSFIGLITRFVYFKYIFIRFCRVPNTFNDALNNRALTILKVVLLLRCLLSLYMYGADGIFAMEKSVFMKWSQSLSLPLFSSIFIVISRIFLTWYYSIFVVVFILCLLMKNLLVDNLIKLCKRQENSKDLDQTNKQMNNIQMVSQRILTKSYKLENNPNYIQILAIMKMKYRKSMMKQSVQSSKIEQIK